MPDIEALADRVRGEFGTVDALFANAGVTGTAPFEETSEELFDRLLTINAKGSYFTVQKLIPLLAEGSSVVITTAVVNVVGLPSTSGGLTTTSGLDSANRPRA